MNSGLRDALFLSFAPENSPRGFQLSFGDDAMY